MAPCFEQGGDLPKLMALAESGATGNEYAAEAKKVANACRQSRVAIERAKTAPACGNLAAATERLAWAVSTQFETDNEPAIRDPFAGLEADMAACSALLPPQAK